MNDQHAKPDAIDPEVARVAAALGKLELHDGDILLIKKGSVSRPEVLYSAVDWLAKHVGYKPKVPVIPVENVDDLRAVSPQMLEAHGWVRKPMSDENAKIF